MIQRDGVQHGSCSLQMTNDHLTSGWTTSAEVERHWRSKAQLSFERLERKRMCNMLTLCGNDTVMDTLG